MHKAPWRASSTHTHTRPPTHPPPSPQVDPEPLRRGAVFLMRMQQPSGDWPQQHISGVFNRNCMITYANYR